MNKDWFPFFSMLFWLVTKVVALCLALFAFSVLATMLSMEAFRFWQFLFTVLAPLALGYFLLTSEVVFDLATAEMRRRQSVAK